MVQNPSSGDIYVAGSISQAAGSSNNDLYVGRFSSALVLISSWTYDKAGYYEEAYDISLDTVTGNLFVTGFVASTSAYAGRDAWIGKFDSSLNVLSTITYNGAAVDGDEAYGLHYSSGVVYVVGSSSEAGGRGHWLARYDTNLVLISSTHFMQYGAYSWDVLPTAGGIFVVGSRGPNAVTSNDTWIGKYDQNLVLVTSAAYNGPAAQSDEIRRLVEDGSGGVYAVGYVYVSVNLADHYIVRYDSNLVRVASTTVNGPANLNEHVFGITRTAAGNVLVAGTYGEVAGLGGLNFYIAEYDSSLAKLSSTSITTAGNASDHGLAILIGANQDIYAAGWATNAGSQDGAVLRFSTNPAYGASAPTGFAGTAQSESAILWSWTDNSTLETGYRVMSGTISVSGDLAANATTWLESGIATSTQRGPYFAQVFNSTTSADSGTAARFTLAAVPEGLAAAGVGHTSATINWIANNPPTVEYHLERSTGAAFVLINFANATSYIDAALAIDTTYHYQLRAKNGDGVFTGYSSSYTIHTASAPLAASGFAGTAQSTGSILWTWTDNSTNETGFRVMSGSVPASPDLPADTTSWWQFGLATNTATGPYHAQAFNSSGTANSNTDTRYTLAAAPFGVSTTSVHQTSGTVTWQSSNPPGTTFELQRSTIAGAGFSLILSTTASSYDDSGLNAASTYYYRARALNGASSPTAYSSTASLTTLPTVLPATPTGFAGSAQGQSEILWSWTDNATNETGYRVLSGSVSISGDLAAGATTWLQTGLATSTAYGPYAVAAFNLGGASTSTTASRWTMPAVSTGLAAYSVEQTSATIDWGPNANGAAATYELERSTGTGFALYFTTVGLTAYAETALIPAATHHYRVRVLNGDGLASAYSSSITIVALPLPPLPGPSGTPVGTALGVSSVSWAWTLATDATAHWAFRPSDLSILGSTFAAPFVQTVLNANTAYGLKIGGKNLNGVGPLSPSATVYTLAADPTGATASSATATTLSVSWGLNGNPGTTFAELDRSTTGVVYSTRTSGAITSLADVDLLGCTTYYYRVRNRNGDSIYTPYSSFQGVTLNTNPSPPSGLTAASVAGGKVQLDWGPSVTEGVTGYRLYWDAGSGTVSYAAPIAVLTSTETTYTTGVLTSSAAYAFALRTAHRCGVIESSGAYAVSGAAAVPAAIRAAIKEPDSGKRVKGNRLTILGELISGIPGDTQMVQFEYKLAASTAWTVVPAANVNHPNPDYSFPYFVHWNVNLLAAGSYDLRAVAYDRNGVPDPAPSSVRVDIVTSNHDIDENDDGAGRVKKDQNVSNGANCTVESAGGDATESAAVRLMIPAGAVSAATTTVSVTANPVLTTATPSGMTVVGSSIKIDLASGQTALNTPATITLTYPTTVNFPSLLQIYYLNEATGVWSRDFTSVVDTASRTVTGLTPHFSVFALLQGSAFANNLDTVRVYPIPFKPNGSNPDEGKPYSSGDAASGIIFDNLAQGSEIKIYTLGGRLVTGLDNPTPAGGVRWDARNQDGREVASGAYFAVIKAPGHKPVVKKIVIIR